MNTLLQLKTSIFSDSGQSSRLVDEFVAAWRAQNPGAEVIERDLARDPVPHLTVERFQAFVTKAAQRNSEQQAVVNHSDVLIAELRNADMIVLGLPMYNFWLPSTLKAYFDHIARAGVTFRYTDTGSVGLLRGKKAVVFAARGGLYVGTPLDTQTAYLRNFLRFLGIEDVEFVYAEGLNIGEASRQSGLREAKRAIERLSERIPDAIAA